MWTLHLASFTERSVFKVRLCCSIYQNLLLLVANHVPLYDHITICAPFMYLCRIVVIWTSILLFVWTSVCIIVLIWTSFFFCLFEHLFPGPGSTSLGVAMLGHTAILRLPYETATTLLSTAAESCHIPTSNAWITLFTSLSLGVHVIVTPKGFSTNMLFKLCFLWIMQLLHYV